MTTADPDPSRPTQREGTPTSLEAPPAPLEGTLVLDLSQNLAGPYATQILADLGADVIKIEPPAGDPARAWGPPFWGDDSPLFLCANRNKRSLVLDLRDDAQRTTLLRLVRRADVFIEAFRAGVAERLGVGYTAVRELNPRIIYASVTAFGTEGPLRDRPGYDPLMQAYAGLMSVTGPAGGEPVRVGTSLVDMGTGLWAALGIMAALWDRDRTGVARRITTSLLDTAVAWMAYHIQGYLATGDVPGPMGTGLGMIAPYEAFPAADGRVMIAAGSDPIFRRLCHALGLDHLASDPRFATNAGRVAGRDPLRAAIAARTAAMSSHVLVARLAAADVPCAPIRDVGAVAHDEQVRAAGMLREADDDRRGGEGADDENHRGGYVDVALPLRWDGQRPPMRRRPPALGEHTEEILRELARPREDDGRRER